MNEDFISQTAFDQMIGTDRTQMMKAVIPYLSSRGQQLLSVYTKVTELSNTLALFSPANPGMQMCAASAPSQEPLEVINDVRRFCYGESRHKLDQMANMLAMADMLRMMNQSQQKEDDHNGQ